MTSQPVLVQGAGSWGTALALVLARNHHQVYLWDIDIDVKRLLLSLDSTEFDMQLKDSKISLLPGKIICDDINGKINSLGIIGHFMYSWINKEELKMGLFIDKYEIPKTFFE